MLSHSGIAKVVKEAKKQQLRALDVLREPGISGELKAQYITAIGWFQAAADDRRGQYTSSFASFAACGTA